MIGWGNNMAFAFFFMFSISTKTQTHTHANESTSIFSLGLRGFFSVSFFYILDCIAFVWAERFSESDIASLFILSNWMIKYSISEKRRTFFSWGSNLLYTGGTTFPSSSEVHRPPLKYRVSLALSSFKWSYLLFIVFQHFYLAHLVQSMQHDSMKLLYWTGIHYDIETSL